MVMTPLVAPTFFMASASFWPISRLLLAAMVATSVISLLSLASIFSASLCSSSTTFSTAFWMPRVRAIGIVAGGDVFEPFAIDGLGQNGGGGGAVAGDVAGLAGGFLDELGAHVLVRVFQLDLFGDGDAVLGDIRAAPALVEHGIAAARPEGCSNRPSEFAGPGEQLLPGLVGIRELLAGHRIYPFVPPMSACESVRTWDCVSRSYCNLCAAVNLDC